MAYNQAQMEAEIIRIKKLSRGLDAREAPHNDRGTNKFDLMVRDSRVEKDNEAMQNVNTDAKIARKTIVIGDWQIYECDAGGAGTYGLSDTAFLVDVGGGCTVF